MCQILVKNWLTWDQGWLMALPRRIYNKTGRKKRINPPVTFGDTPHSNCTSEPDIDKPYSSSDLCIANVIFVFNNFLLNIPSDIIICSSIPPEGELVAVHLSGLRKSLVSGSGVLFVLLAVHPRLNSRRFQLDLKRVHF